MGCCSSNFSRLLCKSPCIRCSCSWSCLQHILTQLRPQLCKFCCCNNAFSTFLCKWCSLSSWSCCSQKSCWKFVLRCSWCDSAHIFSIPGKDPPHNPWGDFSSFLENKLSEKSLHCPFLYLLGATTSPGTLTIFLFYFIQKQVLHVCIQYKNICSMCVVSLGNKREQLSWKTEKIFWCNSL